MKMSKNSSENSGGSAGVSFWGLLTIALIVLKLCGVIHWSWCLVLAPLWIPVLFAVIVAIIVTIALILFFNLILPIVLNAFNIFDSMI